MAVPLKKRERTVADNRALEVKPALNVCRKRLALGCVLVINIR